MRKGLIILLFISLLCLYLLPLSLSETNFTTKADDLKQLKQEKPRKDLQDRAAVEVMRAKSVYGSASDIHHGRPKNDANPLQIKSISSLLWKVSYGLLGFCLLKGF